MKKDNVSTLKDLKNENDRKKQKQEDELKTLQSSEDNYVDDEDGELSVRFFAKKKSER